MSHDPKLFCGACEKCIRRRERLVRDYPVKRLGKILRWHPRFDCGPFGEPDPEMPEDMLYEQLKMSVDAERFKQGAAKGESE